MRVIGKRDRSAQFIGDRSRGDSRNGESQDGKCGEMFNAGPPLSEKARLTPRPLKT